MLYILYHQVIKWYKRCETSQRHKESSNQRRNKQWFYNLVNMCYILQCRKLCFSSFDIVFFLIYLNSLYILLVFVSILLETSMAVLLIMKQLEFPIPDTNCFKCTLKDILEFHEGTSIHWHYIVLFRSNKCWCLESCICRLGEKYPFVCIKLTKEICWVWREPLHCKLPSCKKLLREWKLTHFLYRTFRWS